MSFRRLDHSQLNLFKLDILEIFTIAKSEIYSFETLEFHKDEEELFKLEDTFLKMLIDDVKLLGTGKIEINSEDNFSRI